MLMPCLICHGNYEARFYGQHRRTEAHLAKVGPRTARFGGSTAVCLSCETEYPVGLYSLHVNEEVHMESTRRGIRTLNHDSGSELINKRNEWIRSQIGAGFTYGEISGELGISRQRVHQICKELGVRSSGRKFPYKGLPRVCFYDELAYVDWNKHVVSKDHLRAVTDFMEQVSHVRRSDS
jgi:hypothetical protein